MFDASLSNDRFGDVDDPEYRDAVAFTPGGLCWRCRTPIEGVPLPSSPLGPGAGTITREEWENRREAPTAPAVESAGPRLASRELSAMKARLADALDSGKLTARELQAFGLRSEGWSYREIGIAMAITHGAARVLAERARLKILRALETFDVDAEPA